VGSVGVGICATAQEYNDQPAISVMIADFPPDSFRIFPAIKSDIAEFADSRAWCEKTDAHFAVVHGDPRNPKTPGFIAELAEAIRDGFLVGGLTSSRGPNFQIAGGLTEGGVSGVLFSGQVSVATALTQGCTPLGRKHEITECRDNIAIRIDDRPALDVFNEEVGDILARDPSRTAGYIFAGFPIKGSDTGDYIVRNLVGMDPENKLLAVGEYLNAGDTIMFCKRDIRTAFETGAHAARISSRRPSAKGLYSAAARACSSGFRGLKTIQQGLGDIPLVGFSRAASFATSCTGFTRVLTRCFLVGSHGHRARPPSLFDPYDTNVKAKAMPDAGQKEKTSVLRRLPSPVTHRNEAHHGAGGPHASQSRDDYHQLLSTASCAPWRTTTGTLVRGYTAQRRVLRPLPSTSRLALSV
jgi:small ligand-binding sensory domain FIST